VVLLVCLAFVVPPLICIEGECWWVAPSTSSICSIKFYIACSFHSCSLPHGPFDSNGQMVALLEVVLVSYHKMCFVTFAGLIYSWDCRKFPAV
jgi:hypothetical protein